MICAFGAFSLREKITSIMHIELILFYHVIVLYHGKCMINVRRLHALVVKECVQISRDISAFLISVVLPLLLVFIYGYGVSLDLDHLRMGLVLEDTSPLARTFAESLTDSRYFECHIARDIRELDDEIIAGDIRGIVVVPSYFTQYYNRKGTVAPIQVIADGSETNTANFAINYVRGAFANWLTQQTISTGGTEKPVLNPQPRYWYNEELESRYFLLPGSLAIIMTLIGSLLTALVVAREWERGTMESMISTPVSRLELVIGKIIPYFGLGLISLTLCMLVTVFLLGVPFRGSYWLFYLSSSVFLFCSLTFGLMVSTIAKNQVIAYQIALFTAFLPAYMLSGFLFEIDSMPEWVQILTDFLYFKYYVQSLQTIFLVGNIWRLIFLNMVPMLLMSALFFAITLRKTAKRLDP
jgi:ABC-2 type transport system permease protein